MSNKLKRGMTMEEKKAFDEKKRAAAQAYQERKKEAREKVKSYLDSDAGKRIPEEIKEAMNYLAGTGQRLRGASIKNELREALEKGPLTAVEIFQKFEYGTPTMKTKIREFIKNGEPADRIWVDFKDGKYFIAGKGENPPKGWDGYLPIVKTEEV